MSISVSSIRSYKRSLWLLLLALPCAGAAFVAGCSDDETTGSPTNDAGLIDSPTNDAPTTGEQTDASDGGGVDPAAQVARGKYLVDHVAACGDCHTPRLPTGAPDMAKYLSGVDCLFDVNGPEDAGCVTSSNLTNDPTGLKNRTDSEIKTMFLDGKRPDGKFLAPVMPYFVFHNMKAEDADAIVAYLRTVTGVAHQAAAQEAPFDVIPGALPPIDPTKIPAATGASAENGRYLAGMVGACLDCHTKDTAPGTVPPIDMAKPFAGNRAFPAALLGLPTPPFPETIYTANLTPHATGLQGWAPQDIVNVLKQGKDRDGGGICPPMPAGPMAAFGGLTDKDALDIATYISGLPATDNAVTGGNGSCVAP